MAGEQLYLDAPRATAGGRDLTLAGNEMVSINNSTVAAIAAASENKPWGNDDIGAAFQKNYAPLLQKFTEAFGNVAQFVEGLGEAAVASVEDNMNADARSGETVQNAYRTPLT
ncbi:hypothetical protein [Actinoplanes derwentensis]|uniref:Excreted virulence factor EspC, type VII ESX diderm n=1 Tax=Actinoplanes derwentensis TaxID=113562 RepID=A0A1H1ZA97_9ACTN|nr:hypothetical protein [Actinoplanes derwentensis]GID82326.1 hypothetical protein Ade03nite_12500 [Actinoplanes derwentensis]SDT30422.1 hypothetical protein SAMN04489716_3212 [Actinoplanes derwentensis]